MYCYVRFCFTNCLRDIKSDMGHLRDWVLHSAAFVVLGMGIGMR